MMLMLLTDLQGSQINKCGVGMYLSFRSIRAFDLKYQPFIFLYIFLLTVFIVMY